MLYIIELFSFFLISLSSYYFHDIGIAPFPYLGLFILLLFKKTKFNLRIILFSLFLVIYSILIPILNSDELKIISAFAFLFSFYAIFLTFNVYRLNKIFKIFILIHSLSIFAQIFCFFVLNFQLDFLVNITGEFQRTGTGNFIFLGRQLFRPTGFFSEPSTYTVHIFPIILLYIKLNKKITFLSILGLISVFLTFSAILPFMLIIFFGFILFSNNLRIFINYLKHNTRSIILLLLPLILLLPSLINYVTNSFQGKMFSTTLNTEPKRGDFFIYLFNHPSKLFFGIGITPFISDGFVNFIINDNGLFIYTMLRFGIFGAIFLFILLYKIKDNYCRAVFLTLWVTKLSPTYPMFFLIYALSLSIISYEKNTSNNKIEYT